jgi:hypothetical protein
LDPPEALLLALESQSDRAAAIIAGAFLEDQIGMTIEGLFVPLSEPEVGALFHGTGPLSGFYAKILVGYAMGIFGPRTRQDIEIISNIRNEFAHNTEFIEFSSPLIVEKCLRLDLPKRIEPSVWELYLSEQRKKGLPPPDIHRTNYLATIANIHFGLWVTRGLPKAKRLRSQGAIRD